MQQLNDYLNNFAGNKPDYPFIIHGESTLTYRAAAEKIQALSLKLTQKGLKPGQTAGILLQNSPEFILSYLAIMNVGAIATLLPWTSSSHDVATLATTTRINTLIYSDQFNSHVENILSLSVTPINCYVLGKQANNAAENLRDCFQSQQNFEPSQINYNKSNAVILFSSGDENLPKSPVLSHNNIINTALSCLERFPVNYKINAYTNLPFFHFAPLTLTINTSIICGGTIIIPPDDTRAALFESISKHHVNLFLGNGGFIEELANENINDTAALKAIDYFIPVGQSFSRSLKNIILKKYNAFVMEAYGIAEAPVISLNVNSLKNADLSIGQPISCCEVKILDKMGNEVERNCPGNLFIRGNNVFSHYFDQFQINGKKSKEWFDTGDIVKMDYEGFLYFVGKQSDCFYRYGFQTFSKTIEEVLVQHPKVLEVVVLHSKYQSKHHHIRAAIITDKSETIAIDEITKYCQTNLPKYLVPDEIEFHDKFERNCIGIIKKSSLHLMNK